MHKRLLDGLVFGAGLAAVIMASCWLFHTYGSRIPSMEALDRPESMSLISVCGLMFGFGFVVGFLAIDSLREGLAARVAAYQKLWREWTVAHAPA